MSNSVLSVFNTYADGSNYDKLSLKFDLTTGVNAQLRAETAGTGTDNINIVLTPAGTGALIAGPPPDGGVTGGNARGQYAVDLQMIRTANSQVSSGAGTVITQYRNTASADYAISYGGASIVNTAYATSFGYGNISLRAYTNSFCLNTYSGLYGGVTQASGVFVTSGDAQTAVAVARRQTTDGTANYELFLDAALVYRATLENNTTRAFTIALTARRTDADGENAMYLFEGAIKRDANAASTALVGAVTKTVLAEDTAAWDADVVADTANGSLKIQVTGEGGKVINWVARIVLAETTG